MKLVAKVKLLTNPEEFRAPDETVQRANAACNWISRQDAREFQPMAVHKLAYRGTRRRKWQPS